MVLSKEGNQFLEFLKPNAPHSLLMKDFSCPSFWGLLSHVFCFILHMSLHLTQQGVQGLVANHLELNVLVGRYSSNLPVF